MKKIDKIGKSVRLHPETMCITKYGILFLVASCVFKDLDDSLSIFGSDTAEDKRRPKEDFVYEKAQKLIGYYSVGNIQVMMLVCKSLQEQT